MTSYNLVNANQRSREMWRKQHGAPNTGVSPSHWTVVHPMAYTTSHADLAVCKRPPMYRLPKITVGSFIWIPFFWQMVVFWIHVTWSTSNTEHITQKTWLQRPLQNFYQLSCDFWSHHFGIINHREFKKETSPKFNVPSNNKHMSSQLAVLLQL